MTPPTRVSLIERLRDPDDSEAWQMFTALYQQLILDWLRRCELQPADAEDLCQEIMAVVLTEVPHFEHSGRLGAFRAWLRRITANQLRRLWDRKSRQRKLFAPATLSEVADQLDDDASQLSLVWDQQHDRYVIRRLLQLVEGRFAETTVNAFRGIAIDHRPATEVAESLDLSLGAVRVAHHRVLRALKEQAGGLLQ